MEVDFSGVDDVESFLSVPEGRYRCRVGEVREGWTRDGQPRWTFRLEVSHGEYAGRTAAWDGLGWTERGLKRAKHVLAALGFDVGGRLELQPTDLVGHEAWVQVIAEERVDPQTSVRQVRPRVPFLGYEAVAA
jgi:hypothetical protein